MGRQPVPAALLTLPWLHRSAFGRLHHGALLGILGAVLGFLVTLTSIGAGGAVMLVYLYPRRRDWSEPTSCTRYR